LECIVYTKSFDYLCLWVFSMKGKKLLPREEQFIKALTEQMSKSIAESLYYSILLAKGVAAIEDYKRNPDKYLVNESAEEYLRKLIDSKR